MYHLKVIIIFWMTAGQKVLQVYNYWSFFGSIKTQNCYISYFCFQIVVSEIKNTVIRTVPWDARQWKENVCRLLKTERYGILTKSFQHRKQRAVSPRNHIGFGDLTSILLYLLGHAPSLQSEDKKREMRVEFLPAFWKFSKFKKRFYLMTNILELRKWCSWY